MILISLQLKTSSSFEKNLHKLEKHIANSPQNSFILFPELFLTSYSYERLEDAVKMTQKATELLTIFSRHKTIAITMITKHNDRYYNTLHIFHKGKIVHTQSKAKLFVLDDERKYFTAGRENDIKIIDIDGIKVASLICFELRFIELWKKVQGADIILVPAMWGKARKENYETLTSALAVANQCYVVASNSANKNMAKSSAIITPFGKVTKDDQKKRLSLEFLPKEIKVMRRYLNTGI